MAVELIQSNKNNNNTKSGLEAKEATASKTKSSRECLNSQQISGGEFLYTWLVSSPSSTSLSNDERKLNCHPCAKLETVTLRDDILKHAIISADLSSTDEAKGVTMDLFNDNTVAISEPFDILSDGTTTVNQQAKDFFIVSNMWPQQELGDDMSNPKESQNSVVEIDRDFAGKATNEIIGKSTEHSSGFNNNHGALQIPQDCIEIQLENQPCGNVPEFDLELEQLVDEVADIFSQESQQSQPPAVVVQADFTPHQQSQSVMQEIPNECENQSGGNVQPEPHLQTDVITSQRGLCGHGKDSHCGNSEVIESARKTKELIQRNLPTSNTLSNLLSESAQEVAQEIARSIVERALDNDRRELLRSRARDPNPPYAKLEEDLVSDNYSEVVSHRVTESIINELVQHHITDVTNLVVHACAGSFKHLRDSHESSGAEVLQNEMEDFINDVRYSSPFKDQTDWSFGLLRPREMQTTSKDFLSRKFGLQPDDFHRWRGTRHLCSKECELAQIRNQKRKIEDDEKVRTLTEDEDEDLEWTNNQKKKKKKIKDRKTERNSLGILLSSLEERTYHCKCTDCQAERRLKGEPEPDVAIEVKRINLPDDISIGSIPVVKHRGRGRPRKYPRLEDLFQTSRNESGNRDFESSDLALPKRRRGRPTKSEILSRKILKEKKMELLRMQNGEHSPESNKIMQLDLSSSSSSGSSVRQSRRNAGRNIKHLIENIENVSDDETEWNEVAHHADKQTPTKKRGRPRKHPPTETKAERPSSSEHVFQASVRNTVSSPTISTASAHCIPSSYKEESQNPSQLVEIFDSQLTPPAENVESPLQGQTEFSKCYSNTCDKSVQHSSDPMSPLSPKSGSEDPKDSRDIRGMLTAETSSTTLKNGKSIKWKGKKREQIESGSNADLSIPGDAALFKTMTELGNADGGICVTSLFAGKEMENDLMGLLTPSSSESPEGDNQTAESVLVDDKSLGLGQNERPFTENVQDTPDASVSSTTKNAKFDDIKNNEDTAVSFSFWSPQQKLLRQKTRTKELLELRKKKILKNKVRKRANLNLKKQEAEADLNATSSDKEKKLRKYNWFVSDEVLDTIGGPVIQIPRIAQDSWRLKTHSTVKSKSNDG